ncbi:hypothetical protein VPH35_072392 [Triticum aestivum]
MPRGHGRGGGGRGGPGMKGGRKVVVVPHKHDGVFITKAKEDPLCTKNMVAGESVYGKKSVSVQLFLPMFMSRSITVGVQGMPLIVLSLLSVTNLDSEFFQNSIILD